MMESSREGFPRRTEIVIHDLEQQELNLQQDQEVLELEAREDISNRPSKKQNQLAQQLKAMGVDTNTWS